MTIMEKLESLAELIRLHRRFQHSVTSGIRKLNALTTGKRANNKRNYCIISI